ncbi:DUF2515 domain-containing protein [Paenibacillus xylaniclasticus]|uniref:DUF2515 domain-containing protein n=1 Tax=Paenibacillus xylaniclasticus TaxID=588083 RepID=UPI001777A6D5|nr:MULTISPECIES: DUF2515 domain-containing protein [Paenibacillus]GFN31970.1 hypothetical protein PCURB6_22300 [Paenibacillus curdlanolyticus]
MAHKVMGSKPEAACVKRLGAAAAAVLLRVLRLPVEAAVYAARYAAGKWKAMASSDAMADKAAVPSIDTAAVAALVKEWRKLERAQPAVQPQSVDKASSGLNDEDRALIAHIQEETLRLNRNNVTRTAAYYALYERCPELHWALLAHLVSRNGGWNMTDLKGEWLPRLLSESKRTDVFRFLERANRLIFGDAYPQLLLYEHSVRLRRPLFHLLPALGVTRFMLPVWEQFWQSRDSAILTVALIVNEQHFIEQRVVANPFYRKRVIDTLFFGMQSLLQLNAVLLPYARGREPGQMKLAGLIIERFSSLRERIEFGKRLYAVLFGVPAVAAGVRSFAATVRHTGSRADYAPQLFTRIRHGLPEKPYNERLKGGQLKPGAVPPYSPELSAAWPDTPGDPPEPGDWFVGAAAVAPYFAQLPLPSTFEMTNEYGFLLDKLELAAAASHRALAAEDDETS